MQRIGQRQLCSFSFSDQQILLFLLIFGQAIIFEAYFSFSDKLTLPLLALLIWRYALIILLVCEVWQVVTNEPYDPVASGAIKPQMVDPLKLIHCVLCSKLVFKSSHHCFRCGKCCFEFDHHCKYLNVCIGGSNYVPFLRLLTTFILYNCLVAGLVLTQEQSRLQIGYLAITVVLMGLVLALLVFHIYLNHWLGMRTIEYLMPQRLQNELVEGGYESQRVSVQDGVSAT